MAIEMDLRRESSTNIRFSTKEHALGQIDSSSPSSSPSAKSALHTSSEHTTGTHTHTCCPYCSDTCGDATCKDVSDTTKTANGLLDNNSFHSSSTSFRTSRNSDPSMQYYTMCEIARHNRIDSAWLVVGDTIYDATTYMSRHPGGEMSILKKSGGACDCTEDFHFHTKAGKKVWLKYKVGKVRQCPGPNGSGSAAPTEDQRWWKFWL
jgi:cytochrome b involved in lipid metabolism